MVVVVVVIFVIVVIAAKKKEEKRGREEGYLEPAASINMTGLSFSVGAKKKKKRKGIKEKQKREKKKEKREKKRILRLAIIYKRVAAVLSAFCPKARDQAPFFCTNSFPSLKAGAIIVVGYVGYVGYVSYVSVSVGVGHVVSC